MKMSLLNLCAVDARQGNDHAMFFNQIRSMIYRLHQRPILLINILTMIVCLTGGWILYAGRLYGAQDDMLLSPLSYKSWELVINSYESRFYVSFAVSLFSWRLLVMLFQLTPETFPWWLAASWGLFCVVSAPINIVASLNNLLRCSKRTVFVLVFACWGFWTVTPLIYDATIFIPVTFLHQLGNIYLLSVGTYLWSKPDFGRRGEKALLIAIYLYVTLNPKFLPAVFVLFIGMSVLKIFLQHGSLNILFKYMLLWAFITGVALMLMVFTTDLFSQTLPKYYGGSIPNLPTVVKNFYKPIPFGYATWPRLIEDNSGTRPWHKTDWPFKFALKSTYAADRMFIFVHLGFGVALTVILGWLVIIYFRRKGVLVDPYKSTLRRLLTLLWLALIFVIAFHASVISYFFTPVFPHYAKLLPTLLMTISWSCFIWAIIQLADPVVRRQLQILWEQDSSKTSLPNDQTTAVDRPTFLLLAGVIMVVCLFVVLPNVGLVIDTYRYETWLGEQRLNTRQTIVDIYLTSGKNKFLLLDCPHFFEAPYFLPLYFEWRGYSSLDVIMEGTSDYGPAVKNDAHWVQLPCTDKKFDDP